MEQHISKPKRSILIFGIGQQAQIASYYFRHELDRTIEGFVIDFDNHPTTILGLPVFKLREKEQALKEQQVEVFVAIGSIALNSVREHYVKILQDLGALITCCISPRYLSCIEHEDALNTFIDPSCIVAPFTCLGRNLLLYSATISHHCEIGDHVSVNAATVGANCRIGRNTVIALSATIESGVTIGEYCLIDSGALVKEDLPPYSVVSAPRSIIRQVDSRRVRVFGESINSFQRRITTKGPNV